ncbi:hypothetical protein M9H77_04008 [Catharanthus roseus]|uniref:Uncharacterized protein n=1 Tax=Catharanthus roseus TaxID=4058 RepID=A0ACC0CD15_CATRO|nr:hypothetical protein M9H77_04008 [Catharanthus roseus]
MLHEMWTSNLKPGAPEILKWDVQAFIAHKRNSLPMVALQKLMDATLEEQIMQEDCYVPRAEPAKNFKLDVHMIECTAVEKLRTSAKDGPLANSSERIAEHIDKKRCNLENEAEIGGMAMEYIGTHDAGNQHAAKKFKQGVNIAALARVVKSIASTGDLLLTDFDFDNDGANPFAATDGDEYHDERNDIASKKNDFVSSQCTFSEDSSESQQTLCMKCNSGGQLLYCSSNACPLVVHESCLGFAAKLDGDGRFYCPFCAYSRALSEYLEVKRKASLARKDLSTFIGLKVGNQPKLSMRSRKSKQNPVTGIDELNENHEENVDGDSLNKADHAHRRANVEDRLQAEPSISYVGNGPPCSEKVLYLTHGELNALENENVEGEGREQERQSPIQPEEQQIVIFQKSDDQSPTFRFQPNAAVKSMIPLLT